MQIFRQLFCIFYTFLTKSTNLLRQVLPQNNLKSNTMKTHSALRRGKVQKCSIFKIHIGGVSKIPEPRQKIMFCF